MPKLSFIFTRNGTVKDNRSENGTKTYNRVDVSEKGGTELPSPYILMSEGDPYGFQEEGINVILIGSEINNGARQIYVGAENTL